MHQYREAACLDDVERLARHRLPTHVWDYVAGGAGGEVTIAANRAALDALAFVPRVLRADPSCDTACELFGS